MMGKREEEIEKGGGFGRVNEWFFLPSHQWSGSFAGPSHGQSGREEMFALAKVGCWQEERTCSVILFSHLISFFFANDCLLGRGN